MARAKKKAKPKTVKRERFEVYPMPGFWNWNVKQLGRARDGTPGYRGHFDNKKMAVHEAVKYARSRAPSQLFIKGRNGRIQDERTYGGDPRRTRG